MGTEYCFDLAQFGTFFFLSLQVSMMLSPHLYSQNNFAINFLSFFFLEMFLN